MLSNNVILSELYVSDKLSCITWIDHQDITTHSKF